MSAKRQYWILAISAALILAVTMGLRNALGLFVSPLNTSTGLGIVTVSFALAVGQFVWGVAQPIFGGWLAGYLYDITSSHHRVLTISIGLSVFAALVSLPVNVRPPAKRRATAELA